VGFLCFFLFAAEKERKNNYSSELFDIPDKLSSIAINLAIELKKNKWQNATFIFINETINKYQDLLKK
jgi:hypothetical protein